MPHNRIDWTSSIKSRAVTVFMRHLCTPVDGCSHGISCKLQVLMMSSVCLRRFCIFEYLPSVEVLHNLGSKKILNHGESPQKSNGRRFPGTITPSCLPFLPNPSFLKLIDKRCEERQNVFGGSDGVQVVMEEPLAKMKYMCMDDLVCAVTDDSTRLKNLTNGFRWNLVLLQFRGYQ